MATDLRLQLPHSPIQPRDNSMAYNRNESLTFNRRTFVKASLIPAVLPLAASLVAASAKGAQAESGEPEITDTNVHLFQWPFRKLKYDRTETLVAKLKKHRITRAWAGSFEAILNKQLDQSNRRLADECAARGKGMLVPIGCVNPAWSDWDEDLRRCHENYKMPGVRLYPAYHGYGLDHPDFARLIADAAKRELLVQIVLRMEDERVHHVAVAIANANVGPLVDVLKRVPKAKVQLINSAGTLLGNNVESLVRETQVTFDIAATEGNGGVGKLIEGKLYSYRGAIPVERLLFGSHAPYFPCESALFKLFESPLSLEQLQMLMRSNAERLIS